MPAFFLIAICLKFESRNEFENAFNNYIKSTKSSPPKTGEQNPMIPQLFGRNFNNDNHSTVQINQNISNITISKDKSDVTGTNDKHHIFYINNDLSVRILYEGKTLWFTSSNLQTIFNIKSSSGMNKRIKDIYSQKKLDESTTIRTYARARYFNMSLFSLIAIHFRFKKINNFKNAVKNYIENIPVENVASVKSSYEPSHVVLEPIGLEECSMETHLNISNGKLIINTPSEIEEKRESTKIIEQEANFPSEISFEIPHQQSLENTSNNSWNDNDFLADEMNRDIVGITSDMIPSFIYNNIEFLKETSIISNLVFNSDNLQFSNFLLSLGKYDKRQLALYTIFGHEDFRKSGILVTPEGLSQHGGKSINEKDRFVSVRNFANKILIPNKKVLEFVIVDKNHELVRRYLSDQNGYYYGSYV